MRQKECHMTYSMNSLMVSPWRQPRRVETCRRLTTTKKRSCFTFPPC